MHFNSIRQYLLLFRAPPPALDNNYDRVLDLWKESKMTGRMDTDSYTIVMAMCERLGSSEVAVLALRENMRSQGLAMGDT